MSSPPVPPPSSASDAADSAGDAVSGSKSAGGAKSNYYFFKSTPAHEAQKYMPTLISPDSAATTATAASPSPIASAQSPPPSQSPEPAAGVSRWNAAGTWEEKDVSSWAHARLTTLLAFNSTTSPPLTITCTKVTGDATLVFTRGKKRAGYDLAITCEWKGTAAAGGGEVKGGIDLPSVDQTSDGDYEMTVTVKERGTASDDSVDSLTRAAKKLKDAITGKIKQFEKELQEQ